MAKRVLLQPKHELSGRKLIVWKFPSHDSKKEEQQNVANEQANSESELYRIKVVSPLRKNNEVIVPIFVLRVVLTLPFCQTCSFSRSMC